MGTQQPRRRVKTSGRGDQSVCRLRKTAHDEGTDRGANGQERRSTYHLFSGGKVYFGLKFCEDV